jgi:hypothetical protein
MLLTEPAAPTAEAIAELGKLPNLKSITHDNPYGSASEQGRAMLLTIPQSSFIEELEIYIPWDLLASTQEGLAPEVSAVWGKIVPSSSLKSLRLVIHFSVPPTKLTEVDAPALTEVLKKFKGLVQIEITTDSTDSRFSEALEAYAKRHWAAYSVSIRRD